MFKSTVRILVGLLVVFLFAGSFSVQAQEEQGNDKSQRDVKEQFEKFFISANESAIFDNGKVSFIKLPISNEGEKLFTFRHAEDGKSFAMTDEKGVKLQVFIASDNRIQSVVMPDGRKGVFNWKRTSDGIWVVENLKFEGDKVLRVCATVQSDACRDAAVDAAIGLAVCAATGGLSVACLAATAKAAYSAYKCYESTQVQIDVGPVSYTDPNNKIMFKNDVWITDEERYSNGALNLG